jgi:hypothetical protein
MSRVIQVHAKESTHDFSVASFIMTNSPNGRNDH